MITIPIIPKELYIEGKRIAISLAHPELTELMEDLHQNPDDPYWLRLALVVSLSIVLWGEKVLRYHKPEVGEWYEAAVAHLEAVGFADATVEKALRDRELKQMQGR